uniref:NADH-ubiquinone oxidoreductase chain 1 n=1 Tax=Cerion incanum TaxID=145432 RepID=A0A0A0QXC6_9EUPU|nr:NADH dehydrogenase subunit 1 [Cerion incanum]AIU94458.1 NADH dehydrogenase subunit 1 [Cerion incanum]
MSVIIMLASLMMCLCVLVSVAFYTLLERKILSYIQNRKGPNVVSFCGILQPIADAIKLFSKETFFFTKSNKWVYVGSAMFGFMVMYSAWILMPSDYQVMGFFCSGILYLCISTLNVYMVLGAGWSSNSIYSLLGSYRAGAQVLSYEVSLVFIFLIPMVTMLSYSLSDVKTGASLVLLIPICLAIWFTTAVAETNRAPFDFAEGESELVSGFNTEYHGALFSILFLSEYSSILFISLITVILMFWTNYTLQMVLYTLIVALLFLVCRGVFPRLRYDLLMMLCWKSFLPMILGVLMFSMSAQLLM